MAARPNELEAAPYIPSLVLAILAILLLFQNQFKRFQVYSSKEISSISIHQLDLSLECDEIRELIEEQYPTPTDFMYKLPKENLTDTIKKLIECKILGYEKDKKYFNQFCEWENFNMKYPESFEEIGNFLRFEEMTTDALESLPVTFIIKKLKTFEGLINKLPIKKILNYLITGEIYLDIWKLFNEQIFFEISLEERNLFMKYLYLISGIITKNDDIILLLIRSENFLISSLTSLSEGRLWDECEDDWIERFCHVENILEKYLMIRKILRQRKDISDIFDIKRFLIDSPISYQLKDAIKNVLIKKEIVGVTTTSILSKILLMTKPVDPNTQTSFDPSLEKYLSVPLTKFYKFEDLIGVVVLSFKEFIEDPIVLLEFLRSFSADVEYILSVLNSVHVFDLVYTEKFPVCEWIRKSLELGSPKLLNFFYSYYKHLVKSEMAQIFREAKKKEMIKNIWKFFVNEEMEIELKFLLLLPIGRYETILYLDFIDMSVDEPVQIVDIVDDIRDKSYNTNNNKTNNNNNNNILNYRDIINYLDKSYKFYLKESKGLHQKRLNIKFNEMNGQDMGGLCRQFLMKIFRILIDEKFGLFHSLNTGKVIPRTLLDPSVLGFIGMLHGQALKSSLKVPWLIDFDYENQPIKLYDLIKELEFNSEGNLVPTCDDILIYLSNYKLFHDRFDFSSIPGLVLIDPVYLNTLEAIEEEYWLAGEEAYKYNLLSSVDQEILNHVDRGVVYNEILELIKPVKSSEIDPKEFLNCLTFTGEAKDLIKRVFEEVMIKANPEEMIPAILKFVSGSIELPPAGLASLNLVVNTFISDEKRLPQASTCHKIINWTISSDEQENELIERLKIAIKDTKGFELE